jgi:hypothetical protein
MQARSIAGVQHFRSRRVLLAVGARHACRLQYDRTRGCKPVGARQPAALPRHTKQICVDFSLAPYLSHAAAGAYSSLRAFPFEKILSKSADKCGFSLVSFVHSIGIGDFLLIYILSFKINTKIKKCSWLCWVRYHIFRKSQAKNAFSRVHINPFDDASLVFHHKLQLDATEVAR